MEDPFAPDVVQKVGLLTGAKKKPAAARHPAPHGYWEVHDRIHAEEAMASAAAAAGAGTGTEEGRDHDLGKATEVDPTASSSTAKKCQNASEDLEQVGNPYLYKEVSSMSDICGQ